MADRRPLRVGLRPLSRAEGVELLAGRGGPADVAWHPDYPLAETIDALALLSAAYAATDTPIDERPVWWLQQIVVAAQVVGDIGYHGPMTDGSVEIGYAVVADQRGRGVATGACRWLVDHAWRSGATRLVAEVEPTNLASRTVLLRNGFVAEADRFVLERTGR